MKLATKPLPSLIVLTLVTFACLAPFLNKAFHIDDTLFLLAARQIQSTPADFYGFKVNWEGVEAPMSAVTKNPPLASYYIAVAAGLLGWDEVGLHLAFLFIALASVAGMFLLAKEFCSRPLIAVLAAISTPVFLLSSTSVMCDPMMVSLWIWAMYLWIRGTKNDSVIQLIGAAFLIALCVLTKYSGASLLPLLFVYSFAQKGRLGRWLWPLLLPIVFLAGYEFLTFEFYGKGLLHDASAYALKDNRIDGSYLFSKTMTGLSFTGGCFITALFYGLFAWRRTILLSALATFLLFAVYDWQAGYSGGFQAGNGLNWFFLIQFYVFCLSGITILFLAASDLTQARDVDSLLLFLWVAGTFVFTSFINWTVNGRSLLPMVPAIGILIARKLERHAPINSSALKLMVPLIPSFCVAFLVTLADFNLADSARNAAMAISREFWTPSNTLWFQGHWGFQYYMERFGAKALDLDNSALSPGDIVVIPLYNSATRAPPREGVVEVGVFRFDSTHFITAMNPSMGAGFYHHGWGPLPFAIGSVPVERYLVLEVLAARKGWSP